MEAVKTAENLNSAPVARNKIINFQGKIRANELYEFDMLRRGGARYVLLLRLCVSHFKLRRRSDHKLPGRRRRRGEEEEEEARVDSSFWGKEKKT